MGAEGQYANWFNGGIFDIDQANSAAFRGDPLVYSGYKGGNAYGSQLPYYEQAAYGFPQLGVGTGGAGGWGGPGMGGGGGGPGGRGGGSQSYSQSGMNDPWGYANAAANVLENMYGKMKVSATKEVDTDASKRGRFNSPVTSQLLGERLNGLDLQKMADIAKLFQTRNDQMYSMSQSQGGGNPSMGGIGPWNMGGFGASLPGFLPAPGGSAGSPGAGNNAYNGTGFGIPAGWSASGGYDPYRASSKHSGQVYGAGGQWIDKDQAFGGY